jgi:hypothetical protein
LEFYKFYELLINRLKERQHIYSERILSGTLNSFDDYKLYIGKHRGFQEAEEEARKLYRSIFDEDINEGEI